MLSQLQELSELEGVYKKRKFLNPLEFYEHLEIPKIFHACKSKIKGLFGGNRSGKTEEGAEYIIDRCLEVPGSRWWACAETFPDSREIQQRKVWNHLPKDKVRYAYYDEVNGFRHRKIIFKNGSMIIFKSYDQGTNAFASDDIDGIWNDEEPPFAIFKEQKMRLLDRDGEMIFTMTSLKGITELMSEIFDDHEVVKSQYSPFTKENLPRIIQKNGMTFFMLWTTENPYINQARVRSDIKVMSRSEIRSRIHGIPTNLSGRIYPMFNTKVHVVSADQLPKRLVTLYMILDPHDRKPWAMQWWVVDKRNTAYCIREYPWKKNFNEMDGDDKSYEDYANIIHEVESELLDIYGRSVYRRIIDPNFGNSTVQLAKRNEKGNAKTTPVKELERLGLKFIDGYDAIEPGHLQVRKGLHFVERDGQILIQPKYFIYEECENTIRHLRLYSHKDLQGADGDERAKPQLTQKYKDYCDLVRYGAMNGFTYIERTEEVRQPTPKRY